MNNIAIISITSWEGNYLKSTVELAKELTLHNKIWFLDYQYTWKDFFAGLLDKNTTIPWKKMIGLESRETQVEIFSGKSVSVYTPWPIIPAFWLRSYKLFSFVNRLNQFVVLAPFKRLLKKRGMLPSAIMTSLNPFMGLGVNKYFPNTPHTYYCFDEIKAAHYLKIFGGKAEELLLHKIDAAIFTSDYLRKTKGANLKNTKVIKNGVHYNNFSKHKRILRSNIPPRVGYLGSIDDRFDISLMESVIKRLPEIDFHFIGRVVYKQVQQKLGIYTNVKFFPPVNSEDVPPIMAGMDVGIIPYLKNDFTVAVYPLKVNEYLSVGLPVIMTTFAELPEFSEIVDFADDTETFVNCIKKSLSIDSEEKVNQRLNFASSNSWTQRATELHKFLQETINKSEQNTF